MSNQIKQKSVNIMGEHLLGKLLQHAEDDNLEYSDAIYSEWVVNSRDPEDGSYEFIFIEDLTQV